MNPPYSGAAFSTTMRGYRWWRVGPDGWLQSPWYGKERWRSDENVARCLARPPQLWPRSWYKKHPSGTPAAVCGCGWYALHDIPRAFITAFPWDVDPSIRPADQDMVFGVCEGWGRVVLGTHGWRAERARPVALYVPREQVRHRFALSVIERRYGLAPVHDLRALEAEWGPDREQLAQARIA